MALENVLKAIEQSGNIRGIVQTLASDSLNPQAIEDFAKYATKYKGVPAERVQPLREGWMKEPGILRQSVEAELHQAEIEKLKAIQEEYPEVVKALDPKAQEALALGLPNKDKKYEAIQRYLQQAEEEKNEQGEQDVDNIRQILRELYPDVALWQIYFQSANATAIKSYAHFYVALEQKRFKEKTIDREEIGKDGKKKYVEDPEKRLGYILDTIEKLNENNKVQIYNSLGELYAQQVAQKKAKKK